MIKFKKQKNGCIVLDAISVVINWIKKGRKSSMSVAVITFLIGLFTNVDLSAYRDTITADGSYYYPAWQQTSINFRTDSLYIVREKGDPQNVWFLFGATLGIVAPTTHPLMATDQDSINLFLFF